MSVMPPYPVPMQFQPMPGMRLPDMMPDIQQNLPMQQMGQPQQELMSQFKPSTAMPPLVDMTPFKYPDNLRVALQYIREAVEGESEDRQFYEYLISVAPTEADKEIIAGIRDDEIGHFGLFRQVYYMITQRTLPEPKEVKLEKPATYCEGLKRALMGEQAAVKKYRRILFALQDRVLMNILFEIITDEIRHGSLYNYLYSKNSCKA